jgi:uncharacterized protein YjiS (DUF1127 family)
MTQTILAFRPKVDRCGEPKPRGFPGIWARLVRAVADWRQLRRRIRTTAELRRKFEGHSPHLLRDIGIEEDFRHTPSLLSPADPLDLWHRRDREPWR